MGYCTSLDGSSAIEGLVDAPSPGLEGSPSLSSPLSFSLPRSFLRQRKKKIGPVTCVDRCVFFSFLRGSGGEVAANAARAHGWRLHATNVGSTATDIRLFDRLIGPSLAPIPRVARRDACGAVGSGPLGARGCGRKGSRPAAWWGIGDTASVRHDGAHKAHTGQHRRGSASRGQTSGRRGRGRRRAHARAEKTSIPARDPRHHGNSEIPAVD